MGQIITAPIKKRQVRSTKLTKEQSKDRLKEIRQEVIEHIGYPALLFVKEGRELVPYYVEIIAQGRTVTARYKCYAPNGDFRCYLSHCINSVSLMTGEQVIVYFDDI